MDAILQINLFYFSPHHKNTFFNSVNSLKNNVAALAEIKKANMLDFTRFGMIAFSNQNQYPLFVVR